MAFFVTNGTIRNDVVRRETRNGVLATFRLETGAPRGGRLWIDVETWGHLAGTIAHHATAGRQVSISGRLTQKTWRDHATGEARCRYVVTATDVDLLADSTVSTPRMVPNAVLLTGTVEAILPNRPVKSGTVSRFRISTGRAGTKTGRLCVHVEHWVPSESARVEMAERIRLNVAGGLAYRAGSTSEGAGQMYIDARYISVAG